MSARPRRTPWVGGLGWAAVACLHFGACRALTVCQVACGGVASVSAAGIGGADGASDQGASGLGGEPPRGGQAGVGQTFGGDGNLGGAGPPEAGAGPSDAPPVCVAPAAECDGTLQTQCESDLDWNARHCGGCGKRCDGACLLGNCGVEEPILETAWATEIVGGDPYHYVLTSERQLLRVARATADVSVLASGLGDDFLDAPNGLAQAAGSLFVWTRSDYSRVQRVPLAGGAAIREPFVVESFGASDAGTYYVEESELWFRPTDASVAEHLAYDEPRVICSSPSLVLIQVSAPEPVLLGATDGQLRAWGPAPSAIEQARCGEASAVLLAGQLRNRQVIRVQEDTVPEIVPLEASRGLIAGGFLSLFETDYGVGFDLTFEVRGAVHVRHHEFGEEAPRWSLGLPPNSELVYRDVDYVWYNSANNGQWASQFKRAHFINKAPY